MEMEIEVKKEISEEFLEPLRKSELSERVYDEEEKRDRPDGEFQRDYTRILYSSSFRRLQGKMQLLGIKSDAFFRNRLTHSLEVAQIARSIATEIGYDSKEIFVVEAGALAHDIGNPPFGHSGERYLNKLCRKVGGFEGNAQTLRILTTVERKRHDFQGLNLTYRTLLGVTKYFNVFDFKTNSQKFIYKSDYSILKDFLDRNKLLVRTLDVQIVDIADEIAYAAHDLEDGLLQKVFTIDEILHDFKIKYKGESEAYNKLEDIVKESRNKYSSSDKKFNSSEFSKLFIKEIASAIIHTLIKDVTLKETNEDFKKKKYSFQNKELQFDKYEQLASGLKEIVFKCVMHSDEVHFYEKRGEKVLDYLYNIYMNDPDYLPPEYRFKEVKECYKYCDESLVQERLVADYLAGLMDSSAQYLYEKFSGISFEKIRMDNNE